MNPMNKDHRDPQELHLTKPRLASCKQKWKRHQETVYWVDIQLAQKKRLKFYQTRCNAIILYDTLPAYCISKVVVMKSEEIIYQKVYVSPRPSQKISYKNNWMNEMDPEVAGSSKEAQRIQPKPKTQLSSTGRPVCGQESTKEIEKRTMFDHEDVIDSTRTVRPVKVSHALLKEAEHLRVQELAKKIENHPHREAHQADMQQNNVCNPFSKNSKAMIRELGNVDLFELCETIPKVQCSHCLLYCKQGIVYCTCGQGLIDSESRRKLNKLRLDGCTLYPELRDKERTESCCSSWQNRRTKRIPYSLECVEEVLQES